MRRIEVGIRVLAVLSMSLAFGSPARGGSCDFGQDPLTGYELGGQEVTCGGEEPTCIVAPFAEQGDPLTDALMALCDLAPDPLVFTNDKLVECFYDALHDPETLDALDALLGEADETNDTGQPDETDDAGQPDDPREVAAMVDLNTPFRLLDLFHLDPRQPIADLTDVPRPEAFFEPIAELDAQTWVVELSVPQAPIEQNLLPLFDPTHDPTVDVKLRGWFIRGSGDAPDADKPLLILVHGAFMDPFSHDSFFPGLAPANMAMRTMARAAAEDGFDVLMYSQRANGISGGWSPHTREPAFDVFRALDQLEAGLPTLGAGETVPVVRSLLESARNNPVVLVGFSQGAGMIEESMALDFAPVFDGLPNEPLGYDLRGAVVGVGMGGSPYFGPSRNLIFSQAAAIGAYASTFSVIPASNVLEYVDRWPGILLIGATGDAYYALAGDVAMYNRARGFKEIRIIEGDHLALTGPEYLPETIFRMLKFAHRVSENDPDMDNGATTTVRREVCNALAVPPMQVPGQN